MLGVGRLGKGWNRATEGLFDIYKIISRASTDRATAPTGKQVS